MDFKAARVASGMSITQLAAATGYSKAHICNVQNGTSKPSAEYLKAFQIAVSNSKEAKVPVRKESLTRRRRHIVNKAKQLDIHAQRIPNFVSLLKTMETLAKSIQENAEVFDREESIPVPIDFDPRSALPTETEDVAQYICTVMIELLIEYKHHLLSSDQFDATFTRYTSHIKQQIAKARAQATSTR